MRLNANYSKRFCKRQALAMGAGVLLASLVYSVPAFAERNRQFPQLPVQPAIDQPTLLTPQTAPQAVPQTVPQTAPQAPLQTKPPNQSQPAQLNAPGANPANANPPTTNTGTKNAAGNAANSNNASNVSTGGGNGNGTASGPSGNPMQDLMESGVYSAIDAMNHTPITRAQLADILVKALKHNTALVSEFPVYRDVPLDYPLYASVEVARHKKLIEVKGTQGFYHPEEPIRFGELYLAISHAITGPAPQGEHAQYLLKRLPYHGPLSEEETGAIAKMAQSHFFSRARRYETAFQPVDQLVTAETLAPYIEFLMFVNAGRANLSAISEVTPTLPAGLQFTISPATGILEDRLKAGGRVRFQVVNAVETIPKGSTLRGSIMGGIGNRTYRVVFNNLRTPEGSTYDMNAELLIVFNPKDKLGFIVPGETFEITTQGVVNLESNTQPPPAKPPGNAPNRNILLQPSKTVPKY